MSISSRKEKTYGILHTEYCFYFFGFAKKINSKKPQKINIYLDDNLIDTILANECIEEIDNTYDLNGFSFSYKLPKKYIGEKHIISFRNYDSNEDLDNSPYELIEKDNPNFKEIQAIHIGKLNKISFLNSLNRDDSENLKEIYSPNTIGFLATKENLEDENFISYIKELMNKFKNTKFKGFYFEKPLSSLIPVEFIEIKDYKDIIKKTSVLIINPQLKDNLVDFILNKNQLKMNNVLVSPYNKEMYNKQVINIRNDYLINKIITNLELFNLTNEDINDIKNNHILMVIKSLEKFDYNYDIDLIKRLSLKELSFIHINNSLQDKEFTKVQKYINKNLTISSIKNKS